MCIVAFCQLCNNKSHATDAPRGGATSSIMGGYKIVNSRAKRAKNFFVPPNSYKLGYTMLIMHNYAVNSKFKCLQYQSAFGYSLTENATRHLLKRFSPCQTISYFRTSRILTCTVLKGHWRWLF